MKKIHYIHGCDKGKNRDVYVNIHEIDVGSATSDLHQVSCKSCIKVIEKYNLKSRDLFPDLPTFDVVAKGCFRNSPKDEAGCHLSFRCPVCGKINSHGGKFGEIGAADGLRGSHCSCWKKGYYIREVSPVT